MMFGKTSEFVVISSIAIITSWFTSISSSDNLIRLLTTGSGVFLVVFPLMAATSGPYIFLLLNSNICKLLDYFELCLILL